MDGGADILVCQTETHAVRAHSRAPVPYHTPELSVRITSATARFSFFMEA
jgi:hypothetical protein